VKEILQNFGSIFAISFAIWQDFVNVCQNTYTMHNLVTVLGLAYRIGVVEQCCQMV